MRINPYYNNETMNLKSLLKILKSKAISVNYLKMGNICQYTIFAIWIMSK